MTEEIIVMYLILLIYKINLIGDFFFKSLVCIYSPGVTTGCSDTVTS